MDNLYNLHGDTGIQEVVILIRETTMKEHYNRVTQSLWNMFWSRCHRFGMRGEFFNNL